MTVTEKQIAEKIKNGYGEKKRNKLEELMRLDAKARRPAEITSLAVGILGSLVLGFGMSLAMKVIFDLMALGIVIGVIGIIIICVNYPLYKALLKKGKEKYSRQILQLSDEILSNED